MHGGVQFNWAQFLCDKFLTNCKGKTFHYALFLLSIIFVVGEMSANNRFPTTEGDLPKATRYTLLWATNDVNRICKINVLWVFVEVRI